MKGHHQIKKKKNNTILLLLSDLGKNFRAIIEWAMLLIETITKIITMIRIIKDKSNK